MREFFSLLLIGLALSMDTFSLSLGMGMFNVSNRKALKLALIVGSMHFMMPFLGVILGDKLLQIFEIKYDILLGFILIIIALQMIIDIIRHEEEHFNLSLVGMLIFSFGVSLDSFSLGLGLKAITSNIYLAMFIFAICSATFTYLGIIGGRFANKLLGVYANIIGAVILFVLGLIHLI
ncbi:putative manganese efflux pump MntP [Mycoplasma sp. CAG:776]|nr:putative manganese efflux pump MntP [Mycoplasma sp. CAG:776]